MFNRDDKVYWTENGEYREGVVSRRTALFYPSIMYAVLSDGDTTFTYVNESDLELVCKAVQA